MHGGKGLAVALQRHHHVKDFGRTEDLLHQLKRIGVQQLVVVGAHRQRLVFVFGIGAEQRARLAVADVDVVDGERVAVDRSITACSAALLRTASAARSRSWAGLLGSTLRSFSPVSSAFCRANRTWLATMWLVS